jgi:hypothetical protein
VTKEPRDLFENKTSKAWQCSWWHAMSCYENKILHLKQGLLHWTSLVPQNTRKGYLSRELEKPHSN